VDVVVTVEELTECPGCHRATPTIGGLCPECWYPKRPAAVPKRGRYRAALFDIDDFDLFDPWLWTWLPVPIGLVLLVLGLVIDAPVILLVGAGLTALRIAGAFVLDGWF
jgi:hypothetical protein